MDPVCLSQTCSGYPPGLNRFMGERAPESIVSLGNLDILGHEKTALFCSSKCPGNAILKTYDLARELRDGGKTTISGFHSPMEKECLPLLLRGTQPLIISVGRSLEGMRLPTEWRKSIDDGRLLLLSPFPETQRRLTAETASLRNLFTAAIADKTIILHAHPGSKTEDLCREILAWKKPVFTLDVPENGNLVGLGASPLREK